MLLLYFGILSLFLSYYVSCVHQQLFRHPCWFLGTICCHPSCLRSWASSILLPLIFLASAGGAHLLMLDLLPAHLSTSQYEDRDSALKVLKQDLPHEMPVPTPTSSQKSWDRPRIDILFDTIIISCSDVESLGLRMSDESIHQDCRGFESGSSSWTTTPMFIVWQ